MSVCREEVIYSTESDRHAPQLDEAMADTSLDILTDSPGAVQANEAAAQVIRATRTCCIFPRSRLSALFFRMGCFSDCNTEVFRQ